MFLNSNVPENPIIMTNTYHVFNIGDRVRIQYYPKKEKEYPYSGGGIIGKIKAISHNSLTIESSFADKLVTFDEIFIIKKVSDEENFDNTPYIDDEEREFWRTHWHTKDGIKEKTAEDIKMLEAFFLKYNK